MAIQIGNITFNNVDTVGNGSSASNIVKSGKNVDSFNNFNNNVNNGKATTAQFAKALGVLDAVSINWNGAIVSGQELNTTGEVLSKLKFAI